MPWMETHALARKLTAGGAHEVLGVAVVDVAQSGAPTTDRARTSALELQR